jgi:hypothetical protein
MARDDDVTTDSLPLVLVPCSNSISLCKSTSRSDRMSLKKNLYSVCQRLLSDELRLDQVIPALRDVTVCIWIVTAESSD